MDTQLQKVPDNYTSLSENGRDVRPHRPHGPPCTIGVPPEFIPLLATETHNNHLLDVHYLVRPATIHRVLSPSLQPTVAVTPQHSALSPSNQKPPQHSSSSTETDHERRYHPPIAEQYIQIMSDATTLLSQRCYPDTCKSLREAVGVFFAHEQRSFVASKNSGGRQKVYFCSGKEGGCPAEVRAFKISTEQ